MPATAAQSLAEQRRSLPDAPGVYLFRDSRGRVIYVGKAKSLRKRVASHFSGRTAFGPAELVPLIDSIEATVVATDAEALLLEQNFIKQHKPRFNIRLRDDKSYPYIAISLDEEFPRVYFTRERHRRGRAYFGPYSNAKRVRGTLDLLQKVFLFRSCEGAEPGRRSGSPCLDYYIKRCEAPCVGYVDRDHYRRHSIDGVIAFLSGRYREIERELTRRMSQAAATQEFELAALERNRLRAVRSLLERQRVANESVGTVDAVAVALDATEANAQVFQVRDGVLSDRQSFYLENEGQRDLPEVVEEFLLQYYGSAMAIPAQVVVQREVGERSDLAEALSARRGGPVAVRPAERGDKRRILELAERNARLALDQERLKDERRRQRRAEALDGLQLALRLEVPPVRIECFDVSNLGGTHTTASMVVFEGGAPKKSDYRRFTIRSIEGSDDFSAIAEVLARRLGRFESQRDLSPHDPERDRSFSCLPNLIVIDGGKGQLSSGLRALRGFRDRGVVVVALAKRIEEVFLPGRRTPLRLAHDTPELQLLQRVRDEAHRFAVTHHRIRRDRAMTASVLDDLRGIGPARKRALLSHFGSPEAVLSASREELEAAPGVPGKVARELYAALNKTGR
ncbi:MAG TPA: excinuclease ABC subunit UvrC [Solirubrobacteraceae bacterium]|jgi:excinuclease ABC subunit C|nr:excinuclease ABC subunit UvrC [Solirubrobacteraceae bacterium]